MSFDDGLRVLNYSDELTVYDVDLLARPGHRPEERLMLAVLRDALSCYEKFYRARDPHGRRMFAEAEAWMLDDSEYWPFSFRNICVALDIHPGYLRGRLVRWKAQHQGGLSAARRYAKPRRSA